MRVAIAGAGNVGLFIANDLLSAGHEDVRVVAVGDRGHGAGLLDAGLPQVVAVEAEADDPLSGEPGREPAEGGRPLVDDGDAVTRLLEGACELTADPSTADDDDVHPPLLRGR